MTKKPAKAAKPPQRQRPIAPNDRFRMQPATAVRDWIIEQILNEDGALHNPDHAHLIGADLEVLWAPGSFVQKGRTVIGQAEEVGFRSGGWQKLRQEQQMTEWFGRVPQFLITLDASFAAECEDADWCALVEHELYHVAQAKGMFGEPVFMKSGQPKLMIVGHDVEEFIGVVRRYGAGSPASAVNQLVAAARAQPEVSRVHLAGACGTCLLRAA